MSAKNRILATLVGFVAFFLLGWLFYGILLMDFYAENSGSALNVMRSDENMIWWALILGNVFQSYLLVFIFGKWANVSSFGDGFKNGAMLGLILGCAYNFIMYGTSNMMNLTGAMTDILVTTVMMAIAGGLIGVMLGRK